VQPAPYDPPHTRERLRNGALRLVSLPAWLDSSSHETALIDRALAGVSPIARLVGLIVVVGLISAARNMAFVWLMLALALLSLATRPTAQLSTIAPVAAVATLMAALLMLPATLLGLSPASAVTRMAAKTFCTVSLTLGLAQGVSWPRMASALTGAHVPTSVVFVVDGALRGITILGRVAGRLAEALELRAVGRGGGHDASVGGVLGMTFLHAARLADAQAEAMACRGYDGRPTIAPRRSSRVATVCYAVCVLALVIVFVLLERAMGA
jgi:energy-coupling factor transporter transmembrane protein EcfT